MLTVFCEVYFLRSLCPCARNLQLTLHTTTSHCLILPTATTAGVLTAPLQPILRRSRLEAARCYLALAHSLVLAKVRLCVLYWALCVLVPRSVVHLHLLSLNTIFKRYLLSRTGTSRPRC